MMLKDDKEERQVALRFDAKRQVFTVSPAESTPGEPEFRKTLILDAISERLIYYDNNMNILWANRVAGEAAGLAPGEMMGRKCFDIWYGRCEPCPGCPVAAALKTGKTSAGEITTPDGRIWLAHAYPVPDTGGNVAGIAEITSDITERKRMEEDLAWEVKVNAAIAELSGKFLSQVAFDEIPALVLELAKRLTDSAFGFVGYIDPDTGYLVSPTMTRDIWDICRVRDKSIVFEKIGGLVGWVLKNKKPICTNTPSCDPRSSGTPPGHIPIFRFLSAPALIDKTTVGLVALANSGREYTDRDTALVSRLAALYAIAIQRKRAEEALQKAKEGLETKVNERTSALKKINEQLRIELNEREKAEEALRKSQASLSNAQRIACLGNWDLYTDKSEIICSDEVFRIHDLAAREICPTYRHFLSFVHPGDRKSVRKAFFDALRGQRTLDIDYRIILFDGSERIVHAQAETVFHNVRAVRMSGTVQDITIRKRTEENLEATRQRLLDIIEFLPDATFVVDRDRKVIAWNRAMEEMTGVRKEDIIGKGDCAYAVPLYGSPRQTLVDLIFADNSKLNLSYDRVKQKGDTLFAEAFAPLTEGRGIYLEVLASPLYDSAGNLAGAIETIRDITERKRMENQLQYLATYDFLTNIPNRYSLEENLKRVVVKAKKGSKSALLFIDLDNFKLVNDTLGHTAGDELLINLSNVLRQSLREEDLLFRFGGDEFAVLLEDTSIDKAEAMAEKLRHVVDESSLCISTHQACFNLTISVGIVGVDGNLDCHKLLALADTALHSAKEGGRNKVVYMRPDEDIIDGLARTNQLVGLMKKALKEDRFVLFFQPVVQVGSGEIIHYEALLRLLDDGGNLVLPGRFIPVAERFGLAAQIDRFVVLASLQALQQHRSLNLFINLSGSSLGDESLLELIESNISTSNLNSSRIGFEITETAAVKDLVRAEHWIRRIKNLGCRFALDDFGIGFSSFSYLRMLPVDYLKIDGTFVRNLDTDPTHRALVRAMNEVAHTLGKKTIAEFVENEDVLRILREMDIDYGQGHFLGEPAPFPRTSCKSGNY